MNLNVSRNNQFLALIPIDERTTYVHKHMGEHKIECVTVLPEASMIDIGDRTLWEGDWYYVNTPPTVEKINSRTYQYTIIFEGDVYFLYNKLFLDEGDTDFTYTGTAADMLALLVDNINEVSTGWSIAGVQSTDVQSVSFSGDSCRTALTKIAEAFGLEYRLDGRNIYMYKSVASPTAYRFEYGRGKGLYSLQRTAIDRANLVTRVYGFGARKNLASDYRNGASRLRFDGNYLENNIALYGVREGQYIDDDIYPQRTGTVTGVNASDELEFTDTSLDFDINDYLLEGTVAKVVFKTGDLAGNEFEIKSYSNSVQTVFILPYTDENGYTLPNEQNRPRVGDQYTLVDIKMPQSYIDDAEAELLSKTQQYLAENSVPRVTYSVNIDEKYVRDRGIFLRPWHMVRVVDEDLGIDSDLQIMEVSYPLVEPGRVTAVISNTVTYSVQERLIAETVNNGRIVKDVDLRRAELSRRTASRFRELQEMVFDPDGYFDGTRLKPNSVETLYLSVGAKSQNFGLSGVSLDANPGGSTTQMDISDGQLVHYEIEIDGLGYVWQMQSASLGSLDATKPYYIYAKCATGVLEGTWQAYEVPKKTDEEVGFYHFYVGILYAQKDGRRDFDFTNGMTYINGDTITTGRIKSLDGLSYFDLSEGKFKAGDTDSSIDWNVTSPNKLTIKGSILQTSTGDNITLPNFKGAYSSTEDYYKGDTVTYNGRAYINLTEIATTNILPTNSQHWAIYSEKGADGADGQDGADGPAIVFRGEHSSSAIYYNNSTRRDVVKRSGVYYIFKGNNATSGSWNSSNWENFGAQFDSVATNLLLAENANIADWIIKNGKITSQDENSRMYGSVGKIHLNGSNDSFDGTTRIEGEGIAVTGQGVPPYLPSSVTFDHYGNPSTVLVAERAVISGYNRKQGTQANPAYGISGRNPYDTKYSAGGFFTSANILKLYSTQIIRDVVRKGSNYTMTNIDYLVICTNSSGVDITINLPSSPETGREVIIKRAGGGAVTINGNGKQLWTSASEGTSWNIGSSGEARKLVYDGLLWQVFKMNN